VNLSRLLTFGFLTWLIPFVVSFFLFTPEGQPLIDVELFKSFMVVLGALVGAFFLLKYFTYIQGNFLKEGLIVGVAWLVLNIVLDLIVLAPMAGMTLPDYFTQIGLRYLTIVIMAITIAAASRRTLIKP